MKKAVREDIEKLRAAYEPFADFLGTQLMQLQEWENELERADDPALKAYRANPITKKYLAQAINSYKSCMHVLANDDGSLEPLERARLDVSKKWALWYVKSLGGNPDKVQKRIQEELEKAINSSEFGFA